VVVVVAAAAAVVVGHRAVAGASCTGWDAWARWCTGSHCERDGGGGFVVMVNHRDASLVLVL